MKAPQLPPGVTCPLRDRQPFRPSFEPLAIVQAADDLAAVLEVVLVLDLPLVTLVVDVADVEEDLLAVGILGDAEHRVGRLALVVPLEPAAQGHRADRVRLVRVERPAGDVQLVRPLVVHVAVAGLPEPVPVVVHEVAVELRRISAGPRQRFQSRSPGGVDGSLKPMLPRGLQQ